MTEEDGRHLDLLADFHFVVAGIGGLCSLFPLVHVFLGIAMIQGKFPGSQDPPEEMRFVGWPLVVIGSLVILFGLSMAGCLVYAGTCLRRRRHHTFCLVMAALACLWVPLGTILGVFTLVVLLKEGVRAEFLVGDRRG